MTTLPREMVQAFRRLEKREQKRVEQEQAKKREKELAEIKEAAQEEMRRQRRNERLTLVATLLFTALTLGGVWYTQADFFKRSYSRVIRLTMGQSDIDCSAQINKGKQFCVELQERMDAAQANWEGILRNAGGKTTPFALHEAKNLPTDNNKQKAENGRPKADIGKQKAVAENNR